MISTCIFYWSALSRSGEHSADLESTQQILESTQQIARRPRETESSQRGRHRHQDSRPREAEHSRQGNRANRDDYYQYSGSRETEYSHDDVEEDDS
jgi:hypothetical protein